MDEIKCMKCEQPVADNIGLHIKNFAFEKFPKEVSLCKRCVDDIAVEFMTGGISILNIARLFKKGGM